MVEKKTINIDMINDFLIISITGSDDSIGLKIKNNFFIKKFNNNIKNNEAIVNDIFEFIKQKSVNIDKNFSIMVNSGPGSFSGIRISIAVAKGIKISKGCKLYSYKTADLSEFNLKNIELLIKNNLLENKLIKPVYIS
jgi:tRNA A37 threonylcarbamoyladenosine modification protein TsaB